MDHAAGAKSPATHAVTKTGTAPATVVRLPALPPLKAVSVPPMWAVAYSPDGTRLAVGTYRRVLVFDATTGAKTGDYLLSSDAIRSVAFSPDGKAIAVGTGVPARSGSIMLLDSASGKLLRTIQDHDDTIDALAWEGNNLLLTAANDESVGVNDTATGKTVATLTEHIGRCLSVAVPTKTDADNGGEIFATGGADKAVKIWDAKLRRVVVNFDQCPGAVWCLAAAPRAGTFVAGCEDGKLRIFQVRADGKRRDKAPADEPDPRTGYMAREQAASEGPLYAVACAPDSSRIVSGGADGKVIVWNGDAGGRQREMKEAKRDIWSVAVSPDSKRVAAASLDGHVRVYDLATGTLVFTIGAKGVEIPPAVAPAAKPGAQPALPIPAKKAPMPARMTLR